MKLAVLLMLIYAVPVYLDDPAHQTIEANNNGQQRTAENPVQPPETANDHSDETVKDSNVQQSPDRQTIQSNNQQIIQSNDRQSIQSDPPADQVNTDEQPSAQEELPMQQIQFPAHFAETGQQNSSPNKLAEQSDASSQSDAAGPQSDAAGPQSDAAGPQSDAASPQSNAENPQSNAEGQQSQKGQSSHADIIKNLPGAKFRINFTQYSGYLNVRKQKFYYYWFVESQQKPESDPVLVWMNGGPGCSSLGGLFTENGPFRVQRDGVNLIENKFSWNKVANVLYLDTPVGTGFSYSKGGNTKLCDEDVAEDNLMALESFFQKFPQFKKSPLYLSGESYGAIYTLTLAAKIATGKSSLNLQGFAIGNGCLDSDVNLNSLLFFIYYHGFMDSQRWDKVEKFCCDGGVSPYGCNFKKGHDTPCQKAGLDALNRFLKADLNAYNIYQNCNKTTSNDTRYVFDLQRLLHSIGYTKANYDAASWERSCMEVTSAVKYLNQKNVRQAIHIHEEVTKWLECNVSVNNLYNKTYTSMKPLLLNILKPNKIRGLIYSGDVDMVCNFLGEEWFAHKLGLEVKEPYSQWKYQDQIAGFVTYYKSLSFLTLKGSGHMVPKDKPEQALLMITKFLANKKF